MTITAHTTTALASLAAPEHISMAAARGTANTFANDIGVVARQAGLWRGAALSAMIAAPEGSMEAALMQRLDHETATLVRVTADLATALREYARAIKQMDTLRDEIAAALAEAP